MNVLSRQLLATLVILAGGLVPDRLSGDGPSRLRDSLQSNLFNRADLERMERGYYEQLLDTGRRLDDLADLPSLRIRRRSRRHLVGPRRRGPSGRARRRPARGGPEAGRRHHASGAWSGAPTPKGCATATMRSTNPPGRSGSLWWATRSAPAGE